MVHQVGARGVHAYRERLANMKSEPEDIRDQLEDLEQDTQDTVSEIAATWQAKAEQVESFELGLERDDVEVDRLALVWIRK